MKVRDLIELLKTKDPDAFVVEEGVHGYHSRFDSINIIVEDGYWLTDHPDDRHGLFIHKNRAESIQNDGQTLLDFSAPTVQGAVRVHWTRIPTSFEIRHGSSSRYKSKD